MEKGVNKHVVLNSFIHQLESIEVFEEPIAWPKKILHCEGNLEENGIICVLAPNNEIKLHRTSISYFVG